MTFSYSPHFTLKHILPMKYSTKELEEILNKADASQVAISPNGTCLNAIQYERSKELKGLILREAVKVTIKKPSRRQQKTND